MDRKTRIKLLDFALMANGVSILTLLAGACLNSVTMVLAAIGLSLFTILMLTISEL